MQVLLPVVALTVKGDPPLLFLMQEGFSIVMKNQKKPWMLPLLPVLPPGGPAGV